MPHLSRSLKNNGKAILRRAFELGQRLKVDVLPRHFYSEIPNIQQLRATRTWRKPRTLEGLAGDIKGQFAWVDACTAAYRSQFSKLEVHRNAIIMNGSDEGYGKIEADLLYSFVRKERPQRIVQVGCGVSTAVCLQAINAEPGYHPEVICVEPYPTEFLKKEHAKGTISLIERPLQDVGVDCIRDMGAGDFLFVDSSHTLGPSGEVNVIILEMLPRLPAGAYAHFHDIYLPYDYAPDVLSSAIFFWHETALLYAFLCMNSRYRIVASLSMLHHYQSEDLKKCFPTFYPSRFEDGLCQDEGDYPSSIFLKC